MGYISDYNGLVATVKQVADRTDTDFTNNINLFAQLAESDINRDIRVGGQIVRVQATVSTSSRYIQYPPLYRAMNRFKILTTPNRDLKYITSDMMDSKYTRSGSGLPRFFTQVGEEIEFDITPDSTYSVEMAYYKEFPSLANQSATTNWVLDNVPGLYLYGMLVNAESFLQRDARIPMWKSMYRELVDKINLEDRYRPGKLQMHPAGAVV